MSRTFWNLAGFCGGVGFGINIFLYLLVQVLS